MISHACQMVNRNYLGYLSTGHMFDFLNLGLKYEAIFGR